MRSLLRRIVLWPPEESYPNIAHIASKAGRFLHKGIQHQTEENEQIAAAAAAAAVNRRLRQRDHNGRDCHLRLQAGGQSLLLLGGEGLGGGDDGVDLALLRLQHAGVRVDHLNKRKGVRAKRERFRKGWTDYSGKSTEVEIDRKELFEDTQAMGRNRTGVSADMMAVHIGRLSLHGEVPSTSGVGA